MKSTKPKLLIVDEAEVVRDMLGQLLEDSEYELFFAEDGYTALEVYNKSGIDVVLSDIWMEPMNGLTLLRELMRTDPDAIVVMMTGFDRKEYLMEAFKGRAFDYLEKPFSTEELIYSLKSAFKARGKKKLLAQFIAGESPSQHKQKIELKKARHRAASIAMIQDEMKMIENNLREVESQLTERNKEVNELRSNLVRLTEEKKKQEAEGLDKKLQDLERRENEIQELQDLINEREKYLEEVENSFSDRGLRLQELEATLEQMSEDLDKRSKSGF